MFHSVNFRINFPNVGGKVPLGLYRDSKMVEALGVRWRRCQCFCVKSSNPESRAQLSMRTGAASQHGGVERVGPPEAGPRWEVNQVLGQYQGGANADLAE